jgi:hypothetical protein
MIVTRKHIALSCVALAVVIAVQPVLAVTMVNAWSPRNRERPRRSRTEFIILHTTEGSAKGSLAKIKRNGEAHYFVDTGGKISRVVEKHRVAFHTGRSMWSGKSTIDNYSIGIEIVGYHNRSITASQYAAVKALVADLQKIYRIPDDRVLTHSMVAYGTPNRWQKRSHRGRKRCGMLFARRTVRSKLGLTKQPLYDPDVKAGRLVIADPYLHKVLYGSARQQETAISRFTGDDAFVISSGRSAWDIARNKYNRPETLYVFPDGTKKKGNEIRNWKKVPAGTKVVLSDSQGDNANEKVKELGVDGKTALEIAGDEYKGKTTIYVLVDGSVKRGDQLGELELASLPEKTRLLVGYVLGGHITPTRTAFDICGKRWNFPSTFYMFPDGTLRAGNKINETAVPKNARVFYRK